MMKLTYLAVAVSVAVITSVGGCKSAKNEAQAPAPQAAQSAAPAADGAISGKVVETMDSGGYTYVCLENGGTKTWVALPQSKVKVGQQVTCQPGMEMKNFTSKTLNRTFASIIFSGGLQ
ncbi:MAG: hypothetical protein ACYC7L_04725 [Nitrospirota bacterium]